MNDDKKKILKFREVGKILVKGPQVMKGYLNNELATKDVLSKDGWFDTGDLGFLIPKSCINEVFSNFVLLLIFSAVIDFLTSVNGT